MLHGYPVQAFLPTTDLDRAEAFFSDVLGLELLERSPIAVVFATPGGQLRVTEVAELQPQPFTVLGWSVPDVRATVAALADAGVERLRFEGMGQDEAGVWASPDGTLVAWFADPDGNVLSVSGGR